MNGKAAKRILEDEVIMGAFAALKDHYSQRVMQSAPNQREEREHWYRMGLALLDVETDLRRIRDSDVVSDFNQRLREKHK